MHRDEDLPATRPAEDVGGIEGAPCLALAGPAVEEIEPGPDDQQSLSQALRQLWRRRWLIVIVVLTASAAAWGFLGALPRLYQSEALLVVGIKSPWRPPESVALVERKRGAAALQNERIALMSRRTAAGAIALLGLKDGDATKPCREPTRTLSSAATRQREKLIDTILSCVDAPAVSGSNIISLKASAFDANAAASLANAFVRAYLDQHLVDQAAALGKVDDALERQIRLSLAEVQEAEGALERYRREHGLYKVQGGRIATQQMERLATELSSADVARTAAGVLVLEARKAQADRAGDAFPDVLQSRTAAGVARDTAMVDQRHASTAAEYGSRHPELRGSSAGAASAASAMMSVRARVLESLERDARAADARYEALKQQLAHLKEQVGDSNISSIHLESLERDAKAARDALELALERSGQNQRLASVVHTDVKLIAPAVAPEIADYPPKTLFLGFSALAAFMLGGIAALLLEGADETFRRPDDLEQEIGLPVYCLVPQITRPGLLAYRSFASYAGALQRLSLRLLPPRGSPEVSVILVTSSVASEGKSQLAASLGQAIARTDRRVLLIDCDRCRPSLHRIFGCSNQLGLASVLTGTGATIDQCLHLDPASGLLVLPAGAMTPAISDLLTGPAMAGLLDRLGESFDVILLDGPPVLPSADGLALTRLANDTLFVVRWGHTARKLVRQAVHRLLSVDANVTGMALSQVKVRELRSHGYRNFGTERRSRSPWPNVATLASTFSRLGAVTGAWPSRLTRLAFILQRSRLPFALRRKKAGPRASA